MTNALPLAGPYNPCPRYPNGTKWEVGMRSHLASACWNMKTFAEALTYLRDQYALQEPRWLCDFWGFIDGPGGRLDWNTIKSLVIPRPQAVQLIKEPGLPVVEGRELNVLQALNQHREGCLVTESNGTKWRSVYLNNAQHHVDVHHKINGHRFAGYLQSLKAKGYYRPLDVAFGEVRVFD